MSNVFMIKNMYFWFVFMSLFIISMWINLKGMYEGLEDC